MICPFLTCFTFMQLRVMTDDMFDVLDVNRKGFVGVEDLVRFFYRWVY